MMIPPSRNHDGNGYIFMFGAMSLIGIFVGLTAVTARIGPAAIPIWFIAFGGMAVIMRGPVGKAIAARIHPPEASLEAEMVVPPELYGELDELRGRIAELEERQDFSERLLSTRPDSKAPQ